MINVTIGMAERYLESTDAENPGNNLYVIGLFLQITKLELEKHFSNEGLVSIS